MKSLMKIYIMLGAFHFLRSLVARYTHEESVQKFRGVRPASRLQGHHADSDAGNVSPMRHAAAPGQA